NPDWTRSGPEHDITTAVGGEDHTEGKCTEGISAMRRAYPYELGERDWTVATLLRASPSWQERPVAYLMRGRPVRRLVYLTNFQSQVSCPSSPCVNTVSAVSTAVSHWLKPARRWPLRLSFQVQGASRDTVASWVVPQRSSWMRSSRNASEVENTACGPRWRQGRRTAARGEIAHWSRCRSTWGAAGRPQDERRGEIGRERGEPRLHRAMVVRDDLQARRHPGIGADHEAVGVFHEARPPLGIERAVRCHVGAQRELDPELREPLDEPSDGGRGRRHPGMRPEEPHLRVERQQLLDGDVVHVGL